MFLSHFIPLNKPKFPIAKPNKSIKRRAGRWYNFRRAYTKTMRRIIGTNLTWCSILPNSSDRTMVPMMDTAIIISKCNPKFPIEIKPMVSFRAMKLKNKMPKMSEKLLS